MHDCPCCGDEGITYTDDPDDMCSCCEEAGCVDHEVDEVDDGAGYFDCQVPSCPTCETRETFCTDGEWHSNCDDPALCASVYYAEQNDLPVGVVALDLSFSAYRELKEMQHG